MSSEKFDKKLVEKFDNFFPHYEANEKMWEQIELELPQAKKSHRAFILIFVLSIFIMSITYFNSPFTEVNEQIETRITTTNLANNNFEKEVSGISDMGEKLQLEDQLQQTLPSDHEAKKLSKSNYSKSDVNFRSSDFGTSQTNLNPKFNLATKGFNYESSAVEILKNRNSSMESQSVLKLRLISKIQSLIETKEREQPFLTSTSDSKTREPSGKENASPLSIGLSFGASSLNTKYSVNNNAYQSLLDEEDRYDKANTQFNLGMLLEYDLSSKWSIQSGINVAYFQEELYRQSFSSSLDTIPNYMYDTETNTGQDTTLIGTAIIRKTHSKKAWNFTNRTLVSIPVMLIYKTELNPKSNLGFGIGFEKTIFTKIEGIEHEPDGTNYDLNTDPQARYGSKGAQAQLLLFYNYNLTKNWALRLNSNYRYALSSNYNNSAPIEKSFNSLGLSLSTHLKF